MENTDENQEEVRVDIEEEFRHLVLEKVKYALTLCFEEDGDIQINVDNALPLLNLMGVSGSDEDVLDTIRDAMIEGVGDIDPETFNSLLTNKSNLSIDEEEKSLERAFSVIDFDGDGIVTGADIYRLMMALGQVISDETIIRILRCIDSDGDDRISFADFCRFMKGAATNEVDDPDFAVEDDTKQQILTTKTLAQGPVSFQAETLVQDPVPFQAKRQRLLSYGMLPIRSESDNQAACFDLSNFDTTARHTAKREVKSLDCITEMVTEDGKDSIDDDFINELETAATTEYPVTALSNKNILNVEQDNAALSTNKSMFLKKRASRCKPAKRVSFAVDEIWDILNKSVEHTEQNVVINSGTFSSQDSELMFTNDHSPDTEVVESKLALETYSTENNKFQYSIGNPSSAFISILDEQHLINEADNVDPMPANESLESISVEVVEETVVAEYVSHCSAQPPKLPPPSTLYSETSPYYGRRRSTEFVMEALPILIPITPTFDETNSLEDFPTADSPMDTCDSLEYSDADALSSVDGSTCGDEEPEPPSLPKRMRRYNKRAIERLERAITKQVHSSQSRCYYSQETELYYFPRKPLIKQQFKPRNTATTRSEGHVVTGKSKDTSTRYSAFIERDEPKSRTILNKWMHALRTKAAPKPVKTINFSKCLNTVNLSDQFQRSLFSAPGFHEKTLKSGYSDADLVNKATLLSGELLDKLAPDRWTRESESKHRNSCAAELIGQEQYPKQPKQSAYHDLTETPIPERCKVFSKAYLSYSRLLETVTPVQGSDEHSQLKKPKDKHHSAVIRLSLPLENTFVPQLKKTSVFTKIPTRDCWEKKNLPIFLRYP